MANFTQIDGSILEGGGQILRLAASLSAILKKAIQVDKIRLGRKKPGLRPQHLKGIELACEMTCGSLTGGKIDSSEITMLPFQLKGGDFVVDTQTAGSIVLLMQVAVPIALYAPSPTKLLLKGGTNADMAPPIDYTTTVFIPMLKKFGGNCSCKVKRRGFYPKGGGQAEVKILPITSLSSVNIISFGTITSVWGLSYVSGALPIAVAEKMSGAAYAILKNIVPLRVKVNIRNVKYTQEEAFGNGSGIAIFAETDTGCILSGSAIGNREISPHNSGTQAANELATSINGEFCVDSYTQDQIIILMALAEGKSTVLCGPLTEHTKTAIYIAEKLTDAKFKTEEMNGKILLHCQGIGYKNQFTLGV